MIQKAIGNKNVIKLSMVTRRKMYILNSWRITRNNNVNWWLNRQLTLLLGIAYY